LADATEHCVGRLAKAIIYDAALIAGNLTSQELRHVPIMDPIQKVSPQLPIGVAKMTRHPVECSSFSMVLVECLDELLCLRPIVTLEEAVVIDGYTTKQTD